MTKRELRNGFTTGTCAAAAAKGAALMLREQQIIDEVEITLPARITTGFKLHGQKIVDGEASCFVVKDSGDDPDITNGAEIHVSVKVDFLAPQQILLKGGTGIGRVTKPGLAVPVGEWAINPVPRVMILEVIKEVFAMRCMPHTLTVTVSVPNGGELAKKTLNERLGIIGGLSILGTTGIVKPVSTSAWTDTIDTAIDVALASGGNTLILSAGRTSELQAQAYLGKMEGIKEESFILMGDHAGHAIRSCEKRGATELIMAGQFAKLLKFACGHEQTHASLSKLDLGELEEWLSELPQASHLIPHLLKAETARHLLELSGNDPLLIKLVTDRVRKCSKALAPNAGIKVLLAGYGGEVLYFG